MSKYLVIVESPTKAKTICTILGKDYEIASSKGHLVDLPRSKLAVDIENGFAPHYGVVKAKTKILSELKKLAKNKEIIYIATDPDREGEAIGWHIKEKLSGNNEKTFYRVIFHEITDTAVKEAFKNYKDFDMNMVNAQTARRVLDRIVGYYLSPLLWKMIVRGLSAGRVQSVALKFIVQREKEIADFIPKTTYSIEAAFKAGQELFKAKLEKYIDKKGIFETKEEAVRCIEEIKKKEFSVKEIIKKEIKIKPPSPHTTSLLQQDSFSKLRFSSKKTMIIAQKLYEGIEIQGIMTGLITYMRTDSFYVNPKAKEEAKGFIQNVFGINYLADKDRLFKEKKGAQLAHEAIRPTSIHRQPEALKGFLTADEEKLYNLIWKRFTASFMKEALYEHTKLTLVSENAEFIAFGKKLIFEGFLKVIDKNEEDRHLPLLENKQIVILENLDIIEHTTKPPPRFNDASLVKLLEEKGIGRPSTYAPTIDILYKRNYIKREKGGFIPTDLGVKVSDMLIHNFPKILDENFTASIEEQLDKVEEGQADWRKILEDFYPSFKEKVDEVAKTIKKEVEFSDKICPQCQGKLVIKWSKKGRFLSCERFPACKYAESITIGVSCPTCKEGQLVERRNKRGQMFYGCSKFPACRFTSRKLPDAREDQEKQKQDINQTEAK